MKKLLFLFAFAFSFHVHAADWSNIVSDLNMAYNRSFNTISDGGGKTYTSSITAVSNTTYQNYNFAGGAAIVTNGNAVSNVRITAC